MPAPTVKLMQQLEDMHNDSQATTSVLWDNTSFLENRLGELMREYDAHTVIAAMLFNYHVLHTRLKNRVRQEASND